ncbi:MAG: glycosyltransferase family 2 protein, partial [Actinomycetota bacterium]|nr:glycosyltransferase family 2 protein [Actinomycetota bacterium]
MSDSAPARSDDPATPVVAPAVTPAVTPAGTLAVVAVVVAHNGARWAADLGAALADQTRAPDRVVVVDTGSRDDTAEDLRAAFPAAGLVTLDRRTSFGSAIAKGATAGWAGIPGAYGSDQASHASWLWVLHDDCAPAPDALEELLAAAAEDGRIGIVGPKVRDFTDRRHLLEVGLTIARSGRRETGLEPREEDQGQHDDLGSVLAVGSAGMLVRRDVWDQLGGFDPNLPLFRDDVDLGWRANLAGHRVAVAPRAVVHHVQAAARGRRTIDAATRRRHLLDRRGALYVLLANLPGRALWLAYPRLVLASVARSVGFGLG